jgi:hypothetical protein
VGIRAGNARRPGARSRPDARTGAGGRAFRALAGETIGVPIFKQGEFAQFVRQAEIDGLGLRLGDDPAAMQVFAVDSAFHEGGLPIGPALRSAERQFFRLPCAAPGRMSVCDRFTCYR